MPTSSQLQPRIACTMQISQRAALGSDPIAVEIFDVCYTVLRLPLASSSAERRSGVGIGSAKHRRCGMDGGHQHSHRRRSHELTFNGGTATSAPGPVRASARHVVQHLADSGSTAMRPVRVAEYGLSMSFASPASPARPPSHTLHAHPPPGRVVSTARRAPPHPPPRITERPPQLDTPAEDGSPRRAGSRPLSAASRRPRDGECSAEHCYVSAGRTTTRAAAGAAGGPWRGATRQRSQCALELGGAWKPAEQRGKAPMNVGLRSADAVL